MDNVRFGSVVIIAFHLFVGYSIVFSVPLSVPVSFIFATLLLSFVNNVRI